jgi:hypothetical protein
MRKTPGRGQALLVVADLQGLAGKNSDKSNHIKFCATERQGSLATLPILLIKMI